MWFSTCAGVQRRGLVPGALNRLTGSHRATPNLSALHIGQFSHNKEQPVEQVVLQILLIFYCLSLDDTPHQLQWTAVEGPANKKRLVGTKRTHHTFKNIKFYSKNALFCGLFFCQYLYHVCRSRYDQNLSLSVRLTSDAEKHSSAITKLKTSTGHISSENMAELNGMHVFDSV